MNNSTVQHEGVDTEHGTRGINITVREIRTKRNCIEEIHIGTCSGISNIFQLLEFPHTNDEWRKSQRYYKHNAKFREPKKGVRKKECGKESDKEKVRKRAKKRELTIERRKVSLNGHIYVHICIELHYS